MARLTMSAYQRLQYYYMCKWSILIVVALTVLLLTPKPVPGVVGVSAVLIWALSFKPVLNRFGVDDRKGGLNKAVEVSCSISGFLLGALLLGWCWSPVPETALAMTYRLITFADIVISAGLYVIHIADIRRVAEAQN